MITVIFADVFSVSLHTSRPGPTRGVFEVPKHSLLREETFIIKYTKRDSGLDQLKELTTNVINQTTHGVLSGHTLRRVREN